MKRGPAKKPAAFTPAVVLSAVAPEAQGTHGSQSSQLLITKLDLAHCHSSQPLFRNVFFWVCVPSGWGASRGHSSPCAQLLA